MGFFSWKTCDTDRSIANNYSTKSTFTVYMITEDKQIFTEHNYEGYGVFGGKDFYSLLAELNGLSNPDDEQLRLEGISLSFKNNPSGDYNGEFKMPKLVEKLPSEIVLGNKEMWKEFWDKLKYPETCEFQGFFYDEVEEEEEEEW